MNMIIFVLTAIIVLGIGYASINNINLIINGTGSVIDNTTATFDVSTLSKKRDPAVASIDVKNNSNGIGARIGLNLTSTNSTYFKVTEHIADTELQAGDITTVTVTIEMLKTPIDNDETTSITATLTADPIDNSTATGSDSGDYPTEPQTGITYLVRQEEGEISVGDEIGIGATEDFYVISSDSTKTVLIAKNNLLVGYNPLIYEADGIGIMTSDNTQGYGLQSVNAVGGYNKSGVGTVGFSATNYWDDNGTLLSPYDATGASYDGNPYPKVYNPTYNTKPVFAAECGESNCWNTPGYSIAYYVEEYVGRLKEMGAPLTTTGRLLTVEEIEAASENYHSPEEQAYYAAEAAYQAAQAAEQAAESAYDEAQITYENTPSLKIIYDERTDYWIGSAFGDGVYGISTDDSSNPTTKFSSTTEIYGVRPVIEIPTSALQ